MGESRETAKVFVTKYALSVGIQSMDAEIDINTRMIAVRDRGYVKYFHGTDWHLTLEEAKKKAETMRQRKIASLKKQIEKLENIHF